MAGQPKLELHEGPRDLRISKWRGIGKAGINSQGSTAKLTLSNWFPHTIPLFKLFPGRPKGIFSSLTAFLGPIFLFLLAKVRQRIKQGGDWEELFGYIGEEVGPCEDKAEPAAILPNWGVREAKRAR